MPQDTSKTVADGPIFRYNERLMSQKLMEINQTCERELAENFRSLNMQKYIMVYQAGYLQALKDYGVPHSAPQDAPDAPKGVIVVG